jgi:hypothetical protein
MRALSAIHAAAHSPNAHFQLVAAPDLGPRWPAVERLGVAGTESFAPSVRRRAGFSSVSSPRSTTPDASSASDCPRALGDQERRDPNPDSRLALLKCEKPCVLPAIGITLAKE